MPLTIATWNINSIRLREGLVVRLLREEKPDIICLQECKSLVGQIPTEEFAKLGYKYIVARGQKAYNGVAIISKIPLEDTGSIDFANLGHARHVAAKLKSGITIHNHYIPAGGDVPDRELNEKFGQKLDYILELRDSFAKETPQKSIFVGDFNIAPFEDDVWSHKQLQKVVSHTPIEIECLLDMQKVGNLVDVVRSNIPNGKLYSWWSYRAKDWHTTNRGRRLDHIWATRDLAAFTKKSYIVKDVRGWEKPSDHVPVFTTFDI